MKFGTLYSYWNKDWNCDYAGYAKLIKKVSEIGFDVLEISADHVYRMPAAELSHLNEFRKEYDITITTNSGPGKEHDLASVEERIRLRGIDYFEVIMEKMTLIESKALAGAIYSYWPCEFANIDKDGAWLRSIESLKSIAKTAERLGITIALEVLNRNESYILNTCEEAIDYCGRVSSQSVKILLDTYHMNIEEDCIPEAVRAAGPWLGHLHVGECNRRLPGMNNSIDWKGVASALHDINYDKSVVMEPFLLSGGSVGHSIRLWRDLSNNADEKKMDHYISDSLSFLRKTFL